MKPQMLFEKPPVVHHTTWAGLFDYARSILFLHEFISQSQSDKIRVKLDKEILKGTSE